MLQISVIPRERYSLLVCRRATESIELISCNGTELVLLDIKSVSENSSLTSIVVVQDWIFVSCEGMDGNIRKLKLKSF